jgi:hypothetical protein
MLHSCAFNASRDPHWRPLQHLHTAMARRTLVLATVALAVLALGAQAATKMIQGEL